MIDTYRSALALSTLSSFSPFAGAGPAAGTRVSCEDKGFVPSALRFGKLFTYIRKVVFDICSFIEESQDREPIFSAGRWTKDIQDRLGATTTEFAKLVNRKSGPVVQRGFGDSSDWFRVAQWLAEITDAAKVYEPKLFLGMLMERMWQHDINASWAYGQPDVLSGALGFLLPVRVEGIKIAYAQSGKSDESQRFLQRLLDHQDGKEIFPYRYLYDGLDYQRYNRAAIPGLKVYKHPDPHEVLPTGLGKALENARSELANEALSMHQRLKGSGDAYPGIVRVGGKTTKNNEK